MRRVWFWRGFWWGVLAWVGVLAMGGFAPVVFAVVAGRPDLLWWTLAIYLLLSVIYLAWLFWYVGAFYRSYSFHVDDEQVTVRKGVVFRSHRRVPLRRVQDVVVKQGPILRGSGLASVHVQTAAHGAQNRAEAVLAGLSDAEDVAGRLLDQAKRLRE